MSTRGAIGFFIDGEEFVTYNHSDSYPDWLLRKLIGEFKEYSKYHPYDTLISIIRRNVANITLVNNDMIPTADDIIALWPYYNPNVGSGDVTDWYCLLRDVQGTIAPYLDGSLTVMIDSKGFLQDSLFCEWAYIFNLDTQKLEIYKGWNKDCNAEGRYANVVIDDEYKGVKFVMEIDFKTLISMNKRNVNSVVSKLKKLKSDD